MSIESELQLLRQAINNLNATLIRIDFSQHPPSTEALAEAARVIPIGEPDKGAIEQQEAAVRETARTADFTPPPEPAKVTDADLKGAAEQFLKTRGRDALKALLEELGAASLGGLDAEGRAAFVARAALKEAA